MRTFRNPNRSARRRTLEVVYQDGAGWVRERFNRAQIGAAFMRAEFIQRVENCPVYLKYPHSRRLVRCVP